MDLTNYPNVLKYAVGDRPYKLRSNWETLHPFSSVGSLFHNGRSMGLCQRVYITAWRAEVDTSGQRNYYTVKDILGYSPDTETRTGGETTDDYAVVYSSTTYELPESKLFPSKNALLFSLDGQYLNGSGADAAKLFWTWGKLADGLQSIGFGDWTDLAGMNLTDSELGIWDGVGVQIAYTWSAGYLGGELTGSDTLIVDGSTFSGATMPTVMDTRAEARDLVFSFDEKNTIWTDGFRLGRAMTGTAAGTSGLFTITGTTTTFTTAISVGDTLVIETIGEFVVSAIASNTSLTVATALPSTFSGKVIAKVPQTI